MNQVIDMCPLTKFEGGLRSLRAVNNELNWQNTAATIALTKQNE